MSVLLFCASVVLGGGTRAGVMGGRAPPVPVRFILSGQRYGHPLAFICVFCLHLPEQ